MNDTVEVVKNLPREPGLHIWRIENMELAAIPEKTYGNFYEGDCYILLNLRRSGSSSSCDLHYWIGEHSSQDEQGTAAFLTAQLDTQLGGFAIQHREFQEHESSPFRSYFKNRLMYKKGGVASGFRHVETNTHNVQRLLHIKGRKNCTAREVSMDWSSFNNGDCFLLDLGKMIIQYNGAESHYKERMKAVRMASDIRDRERGGRAQLGIVDGDQESSSPELMGVLHSVLGQRKGNLPPATPDTTPDRETMANLKLYLVSETDGKLMVEEMATRPLTQDLLNSKDCYILDQCGVKISVWKGKHSTQEEKQAAMKQALGFIKAKGYPQTTNVETMVDGAESAMFKHLFTDWKDRDQTEGFGRTYSINRVAKVEQKKIDVMTLHAQPQLAAEQRMVDDGSGTIEVFRVEDLELAPVPKKLFGQFYGGDCYLVLYTYNLNHRQAYIIYMWQGLKASNDEVTASAYQCVELDNKVNGQAVQVRVTMGKEPKHFLAIFKGKLVIYQGGTSRVGGNSEEPLVRLFQVRGTNETNTKAIEVPARSTSLNSNDVFVLKRKMDTHCFLWCGKGCSGDEREMARTVADLISHQEKSMELEGNESSEFWAALGGKAPYSNDKRLQDENVDAEPRLFECSTQTGRFDVTEICNFTQEDLDEEDVMLLDTWDQVFLWLGSGASKAEKDESLNIAKEYIHTHPANQNTDRPVILVKQGFEPLTFTGWFMAWDPHKWSSGKSYEELRSEFGDEAAVRNISSEMTNTSMSNTGHPGSSTSSTRGGMSSDRSDSMYGNKDDSYGNKDGSYGSRDGSYGSRDGSYGNRDSSYGNRDSSYGNRDSSYGNRDSSYGNRDGSSHSGDGTPTSHSTTFNDSYTTYPAVMLTNKNSDELPEDVDPSIKEKYLSEDEFYEIMEMPRHAFEALPVWRQRNMKKAAGLF